MKFYIIATVYLFNAWKLLSDPWLNSSILYKFVFFSMFVTISLLSITKQGEDL